MIEVEKKFQPTDEQLRQLLDGAEFVAEKILHDVYYDFPDFRTFKKGNRLRKRSDGYELKVYIPTQSGVAVAREYDTEESILENLDIQVKVQSLDELVKEYMQIVCDYTTLRKEYKKNGFTIDVDEMSFGVDVTEIEKLVEHQSQINDAEKEILDFSHAIGMEAKELPLKTELYLRNVHPEIHEQIFGKNKLNTELRMK